MKKILGVMAAMFFLIFWPFGGIWAMIFRSIIGGGVEQSFIYPIYAGLIILSGIIVGCAVILHEEIKALRDEIRNSKEGGITSPEKE